MKNEIKTFLNEIKTFLAGLILGIAVTATVTAVKHIDKPDNITQPQLQQIELMELRLKEFNHRLDLMIEHERELYGDKIK